MKEHGIIMTGESVLATYADLKTMTRRVVKLSRGFEPGTLEIDPDGNPVAIWKGSGCLSRVPCPYGKPGDLLRVRETWRPWMESWKCGVEYKADGGNKTDISREQIESLTKIDLRFPGARKDRHSPNWRSSRFMPKWAARLWLRVTDMRVERVQGISVEDIVAEGVRVELNDGSDIGNTKFPDSWDSWTREDQDKWSKKMARAVYFARCDNTDRLVAEFHRLWDLINAKRGHGWDVNDWVRAITYERIERP